MGPLVALVEVVHGASEPDRLDLNINLVKFETNNSTKYESQLLIN